MIPVWKRAEMAAQEFEVDCALAGVDEQQMMETLTAMVENAEVEIILQVCAKHSIETEELLHEMHWSSELREQAYINNQLGLPTNGQ